MLVMTTEYCEPDQASWTFVSESEVSVPLATLSPLESHWYTSGGLPVANTEKVTLEPCATVWLCGCAMITGGQTTVRVAMLLVTEPPALVMTTEYCEPDHESCTFVSTSAAFL